MIGYFSTEPLAAWLVSVPGALPLELEQLENGTLPKTDILLLPAYYNLDEETQPADLNTGLLGLNEVVYVSEAALPDGCFYYNGWPRPSVNQTLTIEVAGKPETLALVKVVLTAHELPSATAPCTPGMLSARVIAMIINEAHLLLQEGHASAEDIDLSMRLGTAYPIGPFAWEQLWGEAKTRALLAAMAELEPDIVIPYFGR